MLVEDDNNLREIYEARLLAEGYEIVSAKDGEEALAIAVREKPDLIISDVMMPKISGFDMLDILRSTAETKDTKVIMMTALSQAEDKERADKLGADRYLVKSQVTLEDVAKAAREVIDGQPSGGTPVEAAPVAASAPANTAAPQPVADASAAPVAQVPPTTAAEPMPVDPIPVAPAPQEAVQPTAADIPAPVPIPVTQTTDQTTPQAVDPVVAPAAPATDVNDQIDSFMSQVPGGTAMSAGPSAAQATVAAPTIDPTMPTVKQEPTGSGGQRVLQPLNDISMASPDLNALLAKEQEREAAASVITQPTPTNPTTPPTV